MSEDYVPNETLLKTISDLENETGVINVIDEIKAERLRQIDVEGWSYEHDDKYVNSELPLAAATYAINSAFSDEGRKAGIMSLAYWPWSRDWWKPTTRRRDLVKAAALLVAEIQRLDRLAKRESNSE